MKSFVLPFLLAAALPAADSGIVPSMNAFTFEGGYDQVPAAPRQMFVCVSEIQSVLHVQSGPSYDSSLGTLLADLAKAGNAGRNELLMANGLWVQKGFELRAAFEKTLADNYRAPLAPVDFIGNSEGARSQINAWTEEHTQGKIKNLFPAGTLNSQTRLVLTSAIYFYGKWQDPFVPTRTQPAPFTRRTELRPRLVYESDVTLWVHRNALRPDPRNALRRNGDGFRCSAPKDCRRVAGG